MTNESEISPHSNVDPSVEAITAFARAIEALFNDTGFRSSPELDEAANAVLTGLLDLNTGESTVRQAWIEYAMITERIAESAEKSGNQYAKSQIAAIIHKACIFGMAGNELRYFEELSSAELYASNMQLDPISAVIKEEIDRVVNFAELSPEVALLVKLKSIISEDNWEFLRDAYLDGDDYDDLLNHTYGALEFEGISTEDILETLGIIDL